MKIAWPQNLMKALSALSYHRIYDRGCLKGLTRVVLRTKGGSSAKARYEVSRRHSRSGICASNLPLSEQPRGNIMGFVQTPFPVLLRHFV
jgi:hypothetical protein